MKKERIFTNTLLVLLLLAVMILPWAETTWAQDPEPTFIWPVLEGYISGDTFHNPPNHNGLDIKAAGQPTGALIYAVADGRVIKAGFDEYFCPSSKIVKIEHQNGYETWYAHLDSWRVIFDQEVHQGQVIGVMGDTGKEHGCATGVHLHFEVRKNGEPVDPYPSDPNEHRYLGKPDKAVLVQARDFRLTPYQSPEHPMRTDETINFVFPIANIGGSDVTADRVFVQLCRPGDNCTPYQNSVDAWAHRTATGTPGPPEQRFSIGNIPANESLVWLYAPYSIEGGPTGDWIVHTIAALYNGAWRSLVKDVSGGWRFVVGDRAEPENKAARKKAIASTFEGSGLTTPDYAIDGNLSTRWSSEWLDGQWLEVDLGSEHLLNNGVIEWETAYPDRYHVKVKGNTGDWVIVYNTTNSDGGRDEFVFDMTRSVRHLMVVSKHRATSWGISIKELELYFDGGYGGPGGYYPTETHYGSENNGELLGLYPVFEISGINWDVISEARYYFGGDCQYGGEYGGWHNFSTNTIDPPDDVVDPSQENGYCLWIWLKYTDGSDSGWMKIGGYTYYPAQIDETETHYGTPDGGDLPRRFPIFEISGIPWQDVSEARYYFGGDCSVGGQSGGWHNFTGNTIDPHDDVIHPGKQDGYCFWVFLQYLDGRDSGWMKLGGYGYSPFNKWFSFESHNFPNHYARHCSWLGELNIIYSDLDKQDATFKMVPGLANSNCVSLESYNFPNHFLRHQDYRLKLNVNDGSQLFKEDATFCVKRGLADGSKASFESYNFPGRYLRHRSYHLWVEGGSGDLFNQDATFRDADPLWP